MTPDTFLRIMQQALLLAILLSAPAVLAALAVGLLVSLFQAATQLSEQTLSLAPKIVVVAAALAVAGLWMIRQLVAFGTALFETISRV